MSAQELIRTTSNDELILARQYFAGEFDDDSAATTVVGELYALAAAALELIVEGRESGAFDNAVETCERRWVPHPNESCDCYYCTAGGGGIALLRSLAGPPEETPAGEQEDAHG